VASNVSGVENAFPTEGSRPTAPAQASDALTFLVTAVEPDYAASTGVKADAVLLLRFTGDRAHAQVVFLPLDVWLASYSTTPAQAFTAGGSAGLIHAVETETGVRMDHYAPVDFDGFRTITDALGGVDVDVPQPYADRGYTFAAGGQHMDGQAALAYVRNADDAAKDTGALQMQTMTQALFDRLSAQGALSTSADFR